MNMKNPLEQLRATRAKEPKRKAHPAVPYKSVAVGAFRNFIYIESLANYRISYPDPNGIEFFLSHDPECETLGNRARVALETSRFISEDDPEWETVIRVPTKEELSAYDEKLLNYANLKTLKALYSNAGYITITQKGGNILVKPWRRQGYSTWEGIRGQEPFVLPSDATDAAFGRAIREALEVSRVASA